MRHRQSLAPALLIVVVLVAACSGTTDPQEPAPTRSATGGGSAGPGPAKPAKLTFGVFGAAPELQAYQQVASAYNAVTEDSQVTLSTFDDADGLTAALDEGDVPDVFLVPRGALGALDEEQVTRPLSDLLDERGVDIGDGYSRDALAAFSFDRELRCMPYATAPDVVYYNKRWVDFERIAARGQPTPNFDPSNPRQAPRWNLAMFTAAAQAATRPRRDVRGLYVAPTLRGLAPFVYSGGGQLFDDDDTPTSLALSDGGSQDALEDVLPLLRDSQLSLTADQLARADPLQWFERGRLGMLVGTRALVPELRAVPGLDFDVLPIPVVDDDATVGDYTGICISATSKHVADAANFLVHAISTASVAQVAQAGYLDPANQAVALSDQFLQPGQLPEHGAVFVAGQRSMVTPPLLRDPQALDTAVGGLVDQLFTTPLLDPDALGTLSTQIDETSQPVLAAQEPDAGGEDTGDDPGDADDTDDSGDVPEDDAG